MCIFELIKVLLYEFYFDYIKNKYGKNSRLLSEADLGLLQHPRWSAL